MFDQDAVRSALLSAGERPGQLNPDCGITEDQSAVVIEIEDELALFTPPEVFELLLDLCNRADHEAFLHEPGTIRTICYLRDLADVVDDSHNRSLEDVEEKWDDFVLSKYDFEEDPKDLKNAIYDVHVRPEEDRRIRSEKER